MILRRKDLPNEVRTDLEIVKTQTERVRQIVKSLLDFSRQTVIEPESTEINQLIEDSIGLMKNQALIKDVNLSFHGANNLPTLTLDQIQFQSVLVNMIINALDATPSGGHINIQTTKVDTNKEREVEINIAETVAETVGVSKATSPWLSLFVLGVMAGAYIGFGGLFATSVTFDMPSEMGLGLKKLVAGGAFSIGLMLVIIAGAKLFTGNTLMISSITTGRITWPNVLARWTLVYIANFIGSILLALLFYYSGLWKTGGDMLGAAAVKTAYAKVHLSFWEALIGACGFLG